MCPIRNGFWDRVISLYGSKFVDMKQIFRTISNGDIYCSTDKVATVYLEKYIFENYTVNNHELCNLCEDMSCYSSVQCTVYCTVKSRKPFGIEHLLRITDTIKLRGFSPPANYTDRATAACRRS
jgi:hypothetical protein